METKAKFLTTKQMTLIALMTALTCILGPLSIPLPFSPVPISFTNLVLYFSVFVLGTKFSTISYIVYLLIGLVGLPVFSRFQWRSGKSGRAYGRISGRFVVFDSDRRIFLWSILKENCHLPFLEWYLERSYVIFSVQSGFLCS